MVSTVLSILLLTVTAAALIATLASFVWAAIKDGEDNDEVQKRLIRRRFPRETK
jgi:hypothetical protein